MMSDFIDKDCSILLTMVFFPDRSLRWRITNLDYFYVEEINKEPYQWNQCKRSRSSVEFIGEKIQAMHA